MIAVNCHLPWFAAVALLAQPFDVHSGPLTGRHFFAVTNFASFEVKTAHPSGVTFTSPPFQTEFDFNQIVVSWNALLAYGASLTIEVQPLFDGRPGQFYTIGYWTAHAAQNRHSIPGQSDSDAEVQTDVVVLSQSARQCKVRLTLLSTTAPDPNTLTFLGVSVLNSSILPAMMPAIVDAPGEPLPVPTRSQLDYAGGDAWCSPTSLSMVLNYWATRLGRPDLDRDVPEVAAGVDDPGWPGTGNWSFNTAYAGSFPGIRAFVTRLGNVTDIEAWVAAGVPVITSVTYSILKGQPSQADGHLVVVVGFDPDGHVQLNDPGTRHSMRKTVPRDRFAAAWSKSHNTVYLIYPWDHPIPASPHGHW